MERVSAVIGASWGDEGKGLVTDFLCRGDALNTIVVRINGGAQAGHTVVAPEGFRHVFHHFGSGTLAQSPSFLSRFMLLNPMLYVREWTELRDRGYAPTAYIDPAALVTTPYDMMINMAVETARGGGRHGSCGLGINETVTRSERPEFRLVYDDLAERHTTMKLLHRIRSEWVPMRVETLGLPLTALTFLKDDGILEHWLDDVDGMLARSTRFAWGTDLLRHWDAAVFEGAQGLRLDEMSPDFPHVTRSRTGLTNVLALAQEAGLTNLQVYYVTRTYLTRHGAGPFPTEIDRLPYAKVKDWTNIEGPWQGKLRFGYLDQKALFQFIQGDLQHAKDYVTPHLAITCVDQLDEPNTIMVANGSGPKETHFDSFIRDAIYRQGMRSVLTSHGETYRTMTARLPKTL